MSRRATAYLRCSDPRQDKSIEQQREEVLRRATSDGYPIGDRGWFIDEGISGRSSRRRTAYRAMLQGAAAQADARRRKDRDFPYVDRMYVWALSRVARNMYDALRALAALEDAGIEVISLTEPNIGDASLQKLMRPILAWIAERYSEELSTNVLRGMRSQAERGYWMHGHVPYGYRAEKQSADSPPRLAVDPETAPVVRRIKDMRLVEGEGYRRIAERLTREGVPAPSRADIPKSATRGWTQAHVRRIMENPVYTGAVVMRVRGRPGPDGERQILDKVTAKNAHEALFTEHELEENARLCRSRIRERVTVNPIHLGERGVLTPFLRCGRCGGRATIRQGGNPARRTYSYACTNHTLNRESCEGFSVRVDLLDPLIMTRIQSDVLTPEGLRALVDASVERVKGAPDDALPQKRAELRKSVRDVSRKIDRVIDAIQDADDATDLKARLRLLQAERSRIRDDLAALPEPGPLPELTPNAIEGIRVRLAEAWASRALADQRKALAQLVVAIELSADATANVKYRWADSGTAYGVQSPFGPPYAPTSFRLPSASLYAAAGFPASRRGE